MHVQDTPTVKAHSMKDVQQASWMYPIEQPESTKKVVMTPFIRPKPASTKAAGCHSLGPKQQQRRRHKFTKSKSANDPSGVNPLVRVENSQWGESLLNQLSSSSSPQLSNSFSSWPAHDDDNDHNDINDTIMFTRTPSTTATFVATTRPVEKESRFDDVGLGINNSNVGKNQNKKQWDSSLLARTSETSTTVDTSQDTNNEDDTLLGGSLLGGGAEQVIMDQQRSTAQSFLSSFSFASTSSTISSLSSMYHESSNNILSLLKGTFSSKNTITNSNHTKNSIDNYLEGQAKVEWSMLEDDEDNEDGEEDGEYGVDDDDESNSRFSHGSMNSATTEENHGSILTMDSFNMPDEIDQLGEIMHKLWKRIEDGPCATIKESLFHHPDAEQEFPNGVPTVIVQRGRSRTPRPYHPSGLEYEPFVPASSTVPSCDYRKAIPPQYQGLRFPSLKPSSPRWKNQQEVVVEGLLSMFSSCTGSIPPQSPSFRRV